MIRFSRNDSLNSDLLSLTGGFNFTFKVSFHFFSNKFQTSVLNVLCLKYQNIIYAFVNCRLKYSMSL